MTLRFPAPLYPIADVAGASISSHAALAEAILAAGVPLLQLRIKGHPTRAFVEAARAVKALADRHGARLIINDRADIALLVDAAGVHLGQDDLRPEEARRILGAGKVIGFSTHNLAQLEAAERSAADYLAFGPIFPTDSKQRPDPIQGLASLRTARRRCAKPLVAIGGITHANLKDVLETGVDAAAVIGAIARASDPTAATRELMSEAARLTSLRDRPRN